jgi:hypothetical protein
MTRLHPQDLRAIVTAQPPPPGVIYPPNLITRAQAARIVKKSPARVHILAKPGGPLQTEDWYGTPMVPMWRVVAYLDAQRKKGAQP